MSEERTFPVNAWYAAAWDHEVKRSLLARQIGGQHVVMYRRADGTAVALEDACWHRLLPLSMGHLDGDNVVCGYHGLEFNSEGRCVFMPSQETLNPSAQVRSYPLVERYRFLWIWLGDPALADPATVPDMRLNDDPAWVGDGRSYRLECDYRLVLDNLMDLTHETFVHASSIGNRAVAEAPFETTHSGDTVTLTRWMQGIDPPPFFAKHLNKPGKVDRWQIIHYQAPATVCIDVGVAPTGTGAPDGDRSQGIRMYVLHTFTPEADGTCHFFWSLVRNYSLGDRHLTRTLYDDSTPVLTEDRIVLEAQQRALDAHQRRPFYNLNIDSGAMWSRRILNEMIATELTGDRDAVTGAV